MEKINANLWASNSRPKFYRWTPGAILCYRLGGVCHLCPMSEFIDGCRMKKTIIELVKHIGAPLYRSEKL